MFNKQEYDRIIIAAYTLQKKLERENDSLKNLQSLLLDLIHECGLFWPCLAVYMDLLQRESALISPYSAYKSGKLFATIGIDLARAMRIYLSEIENRPVTQQLHTTVQNGYFLLCKMTGKSGLVKEFVEEYLRLYGPSNALLFFQSGYVSLR